MTPKNAPWIYTNTILYHSYICQLHYCQNTPQKFVLEFSQERDSFLLGYDAGALANQISAFRGNVLFRTWRIEMSKKSDIDSWRWEHYTALKFRHPATQGRRIISQSDVTTSSSSIFLDSKIKFLSHTKTHKKLNILISAFYVVAEWRRILNWRIVKIKWNLFVF